MNLISNHSKFALLYLLIAAMFSCNNKPTQNSNDQKPFSLSFEEIESRNKINPKKSLIFIYDPMCEDCTSVKMYALENPENQQYMQQHFYTADISIYEEQDIQFNNKTWKYNKDIVGRPYHELAQVLNQDENITAPCLTFLDENLSIIVPIKKTVTAEELEILLVFVATDSFKKMAIEQFQQQYQKGSYAPPR